MFNGTYLSYYVYMIYLCIHVHMSSLRKLHSDIHIIYIYAHMQSTEIIYVACSSLEEAVTSLTQLKLQASQALQGRSYKFLDLKQFPEAFELVNFQNPNSSNIVVGCCEYPELDPVVLSVSAKACEKRMNRTELNNESVQHECRL